MMFGMEKSLVYHNAMQLSIPFWLAAAFLVFVPGIDFYGIGAAVVLGAVIPDIDHFSMWGKYGRGSVWKFLKFCVQSDRHRKVFLPFHNYVSGLLVTVAGLAMIPFDIYLAGFFMAFSIHLLFDFLADYYILRYYKHWKLKNWFDEKIFSMSTVNQTKGRKSL